ncbi:MAG: glycoside hydrolase family 97 N-terminal domain-containing protein, partial [Muribaculaceae bacterium]|nr:glycoside hydrolase family 97 N-terminal domain-containing protein [Muribaculaceae bacterium]
MNNNLYFSLLAAVTAAMATSCSNDTSTHQSLSSPDGQIQLTFDLTTNGRPYYSMVFQGDTIIRPSMLGFELKDQKPLTDGFKIQSVTTDAVDETWVPVWGENDSIENRYNTMTIALKQDDRRLDIEFRVFDNGMGLRYIFPEQAQKTFEITGEFTEMAMGGDYTAWWIPGDYDTQEYEYTKSKLSEIRSLSTKDQMGNISQSVFSPTGVQTSLMLKTPGG